MLKRFSAALAAVFVATSAFGAGTIPFSLSQPLDNLGKPLAGCQFYTIVAGTTSTPQNAFQDSALTIPLPNPQTCDAAGRLPQFFLADGSIKVRLTDVNGVTVLVADGILVIGPSGGGGGGSTVDPTTIIKTGDIKATYGVGVVAGFVRLNGRTIGSATSGGTERSNADTQALFTFLWNADTSLVVSTGRGVSAAADWASNKTITLPDFRSRALAGLGDMGNTDNALFSGTTFTSGNSTTLGSKLGASRRTLLTANLPAYTPSGTVTASVPMETLNGVTNGAFNVTKVSGGNDSGLNANVGSFNATASFAGNTNGGTSTAFDAISPYALITIYLKL